MFDTIAQPICDLALPIKRMRRFARLTGILCYARQFGALVVLLSVPTLPDNSARAQDRAKDPAQERPDSGGILIPEQAAYDVRSYELDLRIDPAERTISGYAIIEARAVNRLSKFVFDLEPQMEVRSVSLVSGNAPTPLVFERRGDRVWVELRRIHQPGETVRTRIEYTGKPRTAANPPWGTGFVWSKTADGQPWIGVACQATGADLWWPCKDHPSDEPERMTMRFTVPKPLICASNGKLTKTTDNSDGTHTFHWNVSTPINNYTVSINIAPYREIKTTYLSIDGTQTPVVFFALPEHEEQARKLTQGWLKQIRFLEEQLGPYPFRVDKIGAAETPYLGMEHQSITAYGDRFRDNAYGFDWLLFHEFTHEWFANLVTCPDWNDMWIHEGTTTYMEALFAEALQGEEAYHRYAATFRRRIANRQPVASRSPLSASSYSEDVYFKAAAALHSLRFLVGQKTVNQALKRLTYPDPTLEKVKTGAHCHFATTEDFRRIVEELSGRKLDWFFEVYFRQASLPSLIAEERSGAVSLKWQAPNGLPFPMPIEVQIDDKTRMVEMNDGTATVPIRPGSTWKIDPRGWVLRSTR